MLLAIPISANSAADFSDYSWTRINDGNGTIWSRRAGLQAVELNGKFFVMGGRTPKADALTFGDSDFHNDVWMSDNKGTSWTKLTDAPWDARAYFQAVVLGGHIYVIGGQDSSAVEYFDYPACTNTPGLPSTDPFIPCPQYVLDSNFFNDVWRSADGITWHKMSLAALPTDNTYWDGRAGLSAVASNGFLFVMGGSVNDDIAVIGPGGTPRIYYSDVWRSDDNGKTWTEILSSAPWSNRAGAVVLDKDNEIYLLGGEYGFTCEFDDSGMPSNPAECPPYLNDVWKSADNGANWTELTSAAPWSKRPGHQCEVVQGEIVCFGGFGIPEFDVAAIILCTIFPSSPSCPYVYDPFEPANPMDIWSSPDGATWSELVGGASPPWNASAPEDIRYDFAAFAVDGPEPGIYTFGGDRETFNPADIPVAPTKVDNDVWLFSGKGSESCYTIKTQSQGVVNFCL